MNHIFARCRILWKTLFSVCLILYVYVLLCFCMLQLLESESNLGKFGHFAQLLSVCKTRRLPTTCFLVGNPALSMASQTVTVGQQIHFLRKWKIGGVRHLDRHDKQIKALVFQRLILIYLDVEVWLSLKSAQMRWWIGSTISSKLDSHGDRFGPHTAF